MAAGLVACVVGVSLIVGRKAFTQFQHHFQKETFGRDYSEEARSTELVVAIVGVAFIFFGILFVLDP